ncbi:FG-GAP-like repeat-containing protein [Rhodopirellula sp. JC639]|uniref:FG-GAP-like repeat-containing protein n=1 Tax=Stieleria mannarensis TaxID=2755585 RepID=UPI001601541A|nr:FG-GAP-like repeat-containing protein [Rhodopirellula sp. JC639]
MNFFRLSHWNPSVFLVISTLAVLSGCAPDVAPQRESTPDVDRSLRTGEAQGLRVFGEIPAFSLTDQHGEPFDRSQLDGSIWVATFVFTRCGATCPYQTAAFTELQQTLQRADEWGKVQLVSFTVDPEFDTPEVLTEYGNKAGADFEHWHFLTGDRSSLWDLSKDGFKLDVQSGRDATNLIAHSSLFVLVDQDSKIRGYYEGLSPEANKKLLEDVRELLDQQDPTRRDRVTEVSVPRDVRDPKWLEPRARAQRALAPGYDVTCDFQFTDTLSASGITFKDNVVDDVKRDFKAAHYDHGSAVSVADVDQDGLLDLYFVCQLGSNQLWRNLGGGKFENITESAGVAVADEVSTGASFADVDNDGDADLYVTRVRAPNRLFLNDGTGVFEDVSEESGLDHVGHSSGAVFFDYDRDGLLDLLLTNVGEYTTQQRGPGGYYLAYKAAFTGHLFPERAEPNILFRNLGDARFENVNEKVGFDDVSWSGDATPIDGNDDGWPDIYLLSMQGHDQYFENQQGKGFVSKGLKLFPNSAWGSMGVKVFDFNRDSRLDLYVTDMHTDMVHDVEPENEKQKMTRNLPISMLATDGNHILGNAFYLKDGKDSYREVSDKIGAENYWPWGISVADLNADGFEDVFITASMNFDFRYGINSVLLNDHGKRFLDSEFILGVEPRAKGTAQLWMELDCDGADAKHRLCEGRSGKIHVWGAAGSRSSVVFDIENDGDLDIVTNDFGGTPMVLTSNLTDNHDVHALSVELVGTRSNRDGLGALVDVQVGEEHLISVHDGKSGYLSQSRMPMYVGLGDAAQADSVTVTWPSGIVQTLPGPIPSNQKLTIVEEGEIAE